MSLSLRGHVDRLLHKLGSPSLDAAWRANQRVLMPIAIGSALLVAFGLGRYSDRSTAVKTEASAGQINQRNSIALSEEQLQRSGLTLVRPEITRSMERPISGFVETAVGAQATIGIPATGRITRLLVAPGSRVRAGQAIAEIRSPEAAVIKAEAEAAQASAQSLAHQYKRIAPIAKEGALAWQEAESKRIASIKAASEARAAQAKAITMGTPDAMGRFLIRTPISGHVAAVKTSPGAVLQAGDAVAEVNDVQRSELRFMVSPLLGGTLQDGQRLRVRAGQREWRARVVAVAPDGALGNRVMVVRAQSESEALPPSGTAVTAFVMVPSSQQRYSVPADAVQLVNGVAVVYRYQRGAVEAVPVVVGRQSGERVEILQGVRSGDLLLSGNTAKLRHALAMPSRQN